MVASEDAVPDCITYLTFSSCLPYGGFPSFTVARRQPRFNSAGVDSVGIYRMLQRANHLDK